jgi:hypothetical protein
MKKQETKKTQSKKPAQAKRKTAPKKAAPKKSNSTKYEQKPIEIKEQVGLGDVVESVTKTTGLDRLVKVFGKDGEDCGCEERKKKWNENYRFFTRTLKPRCITGEEYLRLKVLLEGVDHKIGKQQSYDIAEMYSSIFGTRYKVWCAWCKQIWKTKITHLRKVLESYDNQILADEKDSRAKTTEGKTEKPKTSSGQSESDKG